MGSRGWNLLVIALLIGAIAAVIAGLLLIPWKGKAPDYFEKNLAPGQSLVVQGMKAISFNSDQSYTPGLGCKIVVQKAEHGKKEALFCDQYLVGWILGIQKQSIFDQAKNTPKLLRIRLKEDFRGVTSIQ